MEKLASISEFHEKIKEGFTVIVFSADWCKDCVLIKPILPEIEESHPDMTFLYADRDEMIDLCQELDVFGIPSFIAYKDGQEAGRFVSKDRKTKEEIEDFLHSL